MKNETKDCKHVCRGGGSRSTGIINDPSVSIDVLNGLTVKWLNGLKGSNPCANARLACHPEGQVATASTDCSISGSHRINEIPNSIVEPKTQRWMFRDDTGGLIPHNLLLTSAAFTMAEILLSLTIIGVVAAITLPSLTGNINERTWNTQRKALYARMSQALPLMDALNGFGTYKAASGTEGTDSYDAGTDTCAETFVTAGLSKVLKINNICDDKHLEDCGVPTKINPLGGASAFDTPATLEALNSKMVGSDRTGHNSYSIYKTKAAAFETQNGESIVVYYNPTCTGSLGETTFTADSAAGGMYIQQRVCANFIYDLNGNKGPNTVGKDIGFMTVMYPFDAQLYSPYPATRPLSTKHTAVDDTGVSASKACTNYDSEYRLPRADELVSMFVNKKLIDGDSYTTDLYGYVSSDFWVKSDGSKALMSQNISNGFRDDVNPTSWQGAVWCIKR